MNILDLTNTLTPIDGYLYIVIGTSDFYIKFDDLVKLIVNQSVRFNTQSLATGNQTINFTDRAGQVAFSDADYTVIPFAYDSDGLPTAVKIPDSAKTAAGFDVNNESGVALTFNYFAVKL